MGERRDHPPIQAVGVTSHLSCHSRRYPADLVADRVPRDRGTRSAASRRTSSYDGRRADERYSEHQGYRQQAQGQKDEPSR